MGMPFGTGETVNLGIGTTTYAGERWEFAPLMPFANEPTLEAEAWIARNTGKTFACNFWGGIEYARAARWKPPALYDPGEVTIDATEFIRVSPQESPAEEREAGRPPTGVNDGAYEFDDYPVTEGEDCQRIAIWQPTGTPPAGGWPCVVYMHGGGNDINSYCNYQTWGHWLAAMGVTVISVGYRLGLFGYFYHPDIAAEGDWAGPHFAHQDRRAALQWVNTHASDLNIDTTKVCITGSSAGGQAVLLMLADSAADSWYTRAWASSGGGFNYDFNAGNSWRGEGYLGRADRLFRAIETVEDYPSPTGETYAEIAAAGSWADALRAMPTKMVIDLQQTGYSGINQFPWLDAADFPDGNSYTRALNGRFNAVPCIFNYAGNEGVIAGARRIGDPVRGNSAIRASIVGKNWDTLRRTSPWVDWDANEQERMLYVYAIYGGPAYAMAYTLADQGQDAWLVHWNYKSRGNNNDGAGHSSNLAYTFGNPQWQVILTGDLEAKIYERDLRVWYGMATALINFTANGDPNSAWDGMVDLDLWEVPPTAWQFGKFDTTTRIVNSIGTESRWATDARAEMTATAGFRSDIFEPFRQSVKPAV